MPSDNESKLSHKSNNGIKNGNEKREKVRRDNRANSIDSQRSLGEPTDIDEDDLLKSDDEAARQIKQLSIKTNSHQKQSITARQQTGKKSNNDTQSKNEQQVSNERILSVLMEMKSAMFTKQEGAVLKSSLDGKIATIKKDVKSNHEKIDVMENRMQSLETKLVTADYERELAKQQALKNNISIFGCPKLNDEDVQTIAINIFKAYGNDFSATDFSAVYRTAGRPNSTSIIVKFKEFDKKLMALNSKPSESKKKELASEIIGATQSNTPIFINNHVTPFFARF